MFFFHIETESKTNNIGSEIQTESNRTESISIPNLCPLLKFVAMPLTVHVQFSIALVIETKI